jgi:mRNA-degrading endonuclease toxin of MazEF toxin-antitoxin module
MKRGELIIVRIPYVDRPGGKNRPALIVQNDRDNARLASTVVAMITGNIRFAHEPTQLLLDPATPDGRGLGLRGPSAVKFCNLFTVAQQHILRVIGRLPTSCESEMNACLKAAFDLP